jgi:hypothetical protein
MMQDSNRYWIAAVMLTVGVAASAAERTITIRDWTGRGFAPEVVAYDVPSAGAEKLRVAGPDGKALPVQLAPGATEDRAVLLFPADLPRDATVSYKVSNAGEVGPAEAGVTRSSATRSRGPAGSPRGSTSTFSAAKQTSRRRAAA